MNDKLISELKSKIKGDIATNETILSEYSHDASLFEVKPKLVVFPRDQEDIESLVNFVNKHKKENPDLSLTGRAAGTDMSGGALSESIIVAFGKYFNHTPVLNGNISTTEPGVFYRDFET